MSHLSEEIERQLSASHKSVDDVAAQCGISRGQLYLWKRGEQTSIDEKQLSMLAPALSEKAEDHAALVRAHLLDEKYGPGSDLVDVVIVSSDQIHDRPRPRSKGDKALDFLAQERHSNRDLNELLIDLARVLGANL